MIPEPDPELIREMGQSRICEYCGRALRRRAEVHHVYTRGASGRVDLPWNLIALGSDFDCLCHSLAQQYKISRMDILRVVGRREGRDPEEIEAEMWRLRRLPKGSEYVPFEGRPPNYARETDGWISF